MSEEAMAEKVDFCGLVKMSHKGFCLATLEKLIKYWPGGSYLVLKSNVRLQFMALKQVANINGCHSPTVGRKY